jgi:DNA-binding NtrC family response regulator
MTMAKILLIDDDFKLSLFLQEALKKCGHEAHCLERADGGVEILDTKEFDLVLVDEHMPGISGSEFLKVVRRRSLSIPAILMTGYAKGEIIQVAKKLNAFVVGKPSGGHNEFWKELEPLLADALQGETETIVFMRRAIETALKAGKTNLAPRLRKMLDQQLLACAMDETKGNQEEAAKLLGVELTELVGEDSGNSKSKARSLSKFHVDALILINNHPEWTVAELTQKLGCSKAKLYRDPIINRALKGRGAGAYRPPAGYKDVDGDVEAYD